MKKVAFVIALAIFSVVGISAAPKVIGMKKAKEIALHQVNGKVTHSSMDSSNGKSIYTVEIRDQKGGSSRVRIDALSGTVIDTSPVATTTSTKTVPKSKNKHWWKFWKH